ncbi:MAG: glycosyltransferase [Chromatiaceae bacterium]|nr:glycosyltransferase [Chromatiaceae bacterium]
MGLTGMRVFLAGTSFKPAYGGPALSVARLGSTLAAAGVTVGLWSADGSVSAIPGLTDTRHLIRLEGGLAAALRAFGPLDLIHDNGLWLPHNHQLAVLARRRGVPRLVSTRGMLEPWALRHKRWKKRLAWALYQRQDLLSAGCHHATSAPEVEHLRHLGLGVRIGVVANGVDLPDLSACRHGRSTMRTALFLGRLYPVKGLPMLIDAWHEVRPAGWQLVLAGPDEAGHRAELEMQIAGYGLGDRISFAGELSGEVKSAALAAADLFVLPSYSESFGMAIAEALAHELPVLTTTGAPWAELPPHGCGWWVAPTVPGLVAALKEATALGSVELKRMGYRGRAWMAAEFSWDRVGQAMRSLYLETVGSGS